MTFISYKISTQWVDGKKGQNLVNIVCERPLGKLWIDHNSNQGLHIEDAVYIHQFEQIGNVVTLARWKIDNIQKGVMDIQADILL